MIHRLLTFALIATFLLPAFSLSCSDTGTIEEEQSIMDNVRIPPMDTTAPTETEKATFALG